jgi:hypothetical protein
MNALPNYDAWKTTTDDEPAPTEAEITARAEQVSAYWSRNPHKTADAIRWYLDSCTTDELPALNAIDADQCELGKTIAGYAKEGMRLMAEEYAEWELGGKLGTRDDERIPWRRA